MDCSRVELVCGPDPPLFFMCSSGVEVVRAEQGSVYFVLPMLHRSSFMIQFPDLDSYCCHLFSLDFLGVHTVWIPELYFGGSVVSEEFIN